ncbi:MAG: hypothetical protein ACLGI5_17845 [Thermoleophilia bacterium]
MRAGARIACALAAVAAAASCQAAAGGTSPGTHLLPPGTLRVSDTRLQASNGERVTFSVTLTRRAVHEGRLELTLPASWTGRSAASGLRYATLPAKGSASSSRATVRRRRRVVRFTFTRARRGDAARYTVTDRGIPARTYALAYRWREGGSVRRRGTATVTVFAVPRPARSHRQ